ncbi:MAG: helix-turn-helix domain-containing protein [Streptosporangiaceae bacterium]
MSESAEHARWERTGAARHEAAYDEARAALLLGQMVYDRRTALGLTQAALAARTGMSQPQLSRLESGEATPTVPLLARLARALGRGSAASPARTELLSCELTAVVLAA